MPFCCLDVRAGAGVADQDGTGLACAVVADAAVRDVVDERSVEVAVGHGAIPYRMASSAIEARIGSTLPAPPIPADLTMK